MKLIEFPQKKEKEDVPAFEFLAALAMKSKELTDEGRKPKVVVLFYEDGYPLEITATEQYPDGVYCVLGLAKRLIEDDILTTEED